MYFGLICVNHMMTAVYGRKTECVLERLSYHQIFISALIRGVS
jgi:hypothetical protein